MSRPEYEKRKARMSVLRETFLREWNATNSHLPEREKAAKSMKDWEAFMVEHGLRKKDRPQLKGLIDQPYHTAYMRIWRQERKTPSVTTGEREL